MNTAVRADDWLNKLIDLIIFDRTFHRHSRAGQGNFLATCDKMILLNAETAFELVERAHDAWNRGDLEGMLAPYADDMTCVTNTGPNGDKMIIQGKPAFRARFARIIVILDSKTFIKNFTYSNMIARIRFNIYVRHKESGLEMTGTFREICTFRNGKIWKIDDFHDAARVASFWRLVDASEQKS